MGKSNTKASKSQLTLDKAPQSYIYKLPQDSIEVSVLNEDAWLSQKDMALLFGLDVRTINHHVQQILADDGNAESTIRKIRIVADDGKMRDVMHYNLDVIISVGYRVGSSQATDFRKWANGIIKQYILMGYVINEKRFGSKSLLKIEDSLNRLEQNSLTERPEYQRLSLVYENKHGAELLWAIVDDVCLNPDYRIIKGMEYKILFGMMAEDIKSVLKSKDIRESLPDRQLKAFTLAETTLREMLAVQKDISNERVLDAIRASFQPIGVYLRTTSEIMGVHPVTNQPLLGKGE